MEELNVLEMGKEPMLHSTDQTYRTTEISPKPDTDDDLEKQEIGYDQELNVKTEEQSSLLTEAKESMLHSTDETYRTTEITTENDTDDDLEQQGFGNDQELNVKTKEQSSLLTKAKESMLHSTHPEIDTDDDDELLQDLRKLYFMPSLRPLNNTVRGNYSSFFNQNLSMDQEFPTGTTEEWSSLLTEAKEPMLHSTDQTYRTNGITHENDSDDDLEQQKIVHDQELNSKTEASMNQDLCRALRSKHADPLRSLLEKTPSMLSEQTTVTKKNLLHIAVMYGHKEVVQEVFGSNQSLLTSADEMGYTPLHTAAESGRSGIVKVLIGHGTPIPSELFQMKSHRYGLTALDLAAMNGHLEVVKEFTSVKKDLLWAQSPSPLFYATICGQWEVVYHILSFPDAKERSLTSDAVFGPSPLHQAISTKREESTKEIFDQPRRQDCSPSRRGRRPVLPCTPHP